MSTFVATPLTPYESTTTSILPRPTSFSLASLASRSRGPQDAGDDEEELGDEDTDDEDEEEEGEDGDDSEDDSNGTCAVAAHPALAPFVVTVHSLCVRYRSTKVRRW